MVSLRAFATMGYLIVLLLAACGGQAGGGQTNGQSSDRSPPIELTVSAAASLTDALNEIRPLFEATNPDVRLRFNFGASGVLGQQIREGAPVDLFVSAAEEQMQELVDDGFIDPAHETGLLGNELVAVVRKDAKREIADPGSLLLPAWTMVAIGIPDTVPAGSYAREALTNLGLWEPLASKIVQAQDVRQVLQYVETGNADIGFVYRTDAVSSEAVRIAFAVDPAAHQAIRYPLGVVAATKHPEAAAGLYAYLQSRPAQDIFEKHGFYVLLEK
jgi:molybdate transport system substrate-binding protein